MLGSLPIGVQKLPGKVELANRQKTGRKTVKKPLFYVICCSGYSDEKASTPHLETALWLWVLYKFVHTVFYLLFYFYSFQI